MLHILLVLACGTSGSPIQPDPTTPGEDTGPRVLPHGGGCQEHDTKYYGAELPTTRRGDVALRPCVPTKLLGAPLVRGPETARDKGSLVFAILQVGYDGLAQDSLVRLEVGPEGPPVRILEEVPGAWMPVSGQTHDGMDSLQGLGMAFDADGDGREDVILRSDDAKGESGSLIRALTTPITEHYSFHSSTVELGFWPLYLGDVTGDGVPDLGRYLNHLSDPKGDESVGILGLPWHESYASVPWDVTVGEGLSATWTVANFYASSIVRGSFDHNGDGVSDVVAGDEDGPVGYDGQSGFVWLFNGPITGSRTIDEADGRLSRYSERLDLEYGWDQDSIGEVASAGDVNGDGYDDLAVAADNASDGDLPLVGRIWIVPGPVVGAMDIATNAVATFIGEGDYSLFPEAMVTRGDVDGDGWIDLFASQAVDPSASGHLANEYPGLRLFRGPLEGTFEWLDGVQIKDRWYYNPSEVSDFLVVDQDLDGDGLHDVVMTEEYAWRDDPEVEYGSRIGDAINIWFSSQSSEWPRPWAP